MHEFLQNVNRFIQYILKLGAQSRNRTSDTGIFSPLLYRLSYLGLWWAFRDSNPGPTGYEPVALTN